MIDSTDFLSLEALPKRILFVGGGFVSFEFAHIAARAGAAPVIVDCGACRVHLRFFIVAPFPCTWISLVLVPCGAFDRRLSTAHRDSASQILDPLFPVRAWNVQCQI
ncbi:FAD-dependent oxidoreductase [Sulfitobacter geojensis]|uniref:FAD-dependent oxidoreductase n=1 Tax=Sulfitobacter geojensis TaxID=1342299 RepID=UPI0036DBB8D7